MYVSPPLHDMALLHCHRSETIDFLVEEEGNIWGADDDTDIEYIYLLTMEKHGSEPTYAQMKEALAISY